MNGTVAHPNWIHARDLVRFANFGLGTPGSKQNTNDGQCEREREERRFPELHILTPMFTSPEVAA
jgi:hypothetical protein